MSQLTIRLTFLFLLCFVASCGTQVQTADELKTPGVHRIELEVDGQAREYLAYLPESFDESKEYPILFIFHGGGGQAETTFENSRWSDKANDEEFIAIFPEGTRANPEEPASFGGNSQSWNDGSGREALGAVKRNVDDVSFVKELIRDLELKLNIDSGNLFATGFSNGASMSFRLGRELSDHFAAIAPVAGIDWLPSVIPDRPPSLLYITGTEDPLNPFDGGEIFIGQTSYGEKPPVEPMILEWSAIHNCSNEAATQTEDHTRSYFYDCPAEPQPVSMFALIGHGHHWPGSPSLLPVFLVGPNSTNLDATNTIWDFFERVTQ